MNEFEPKAVLVVSLGAMVLTSGPRATVYNLTPDTTRTPKEQSRVNSLRGAVGNVGIPKPAPGLLAVVGLLFIAIAGALARFRKPPS
jgi:hypothetical protein